jgi:hypothetical protein
VEVTAPSLAPGGEAGAYGGPVLADGTYDVIVVDADQVGAPDADAIRLDLTVLAGAHKGEVVSMRAEGLGVDPIDALGLPGTLTVQDGDPSIALDR